MEIVEQELDSSYELEQIKGYVYCAIYKAHNMVQATFCFTDLYSKQALITQLNQLLGVTEARIYKIPNPFTQ